MGKKRKRKEAEMLAQMALGNVFSIEAKDKIKPHGPRLREEVYETIVQFGPVTDEQIAYYAQMNPSTSRPRRLELLREGRIAQVGEGKTKAGRRAALWGVA